MLKLIWYRKKSISIIRFEYLNKHFRIFFFFFEVHFFYRLNNVEKIPDNEKKNQISKIWFQTSEECTVKLWKFNQNWQEFPQFFFLIESFSFSLNVWFLWNDDVQVNHFELFFVCLAFYSRKILSKLPSSVEISFAQ